MLRLDLRVTHRIASGRRSHDNCNAIAAIDLNAANASGSLSCTVHFSRAGAKFELTFDSTP